MNEPCAKVELSFQCKDLKQFDVLSKTDAFIVVSELPHGQKKWSKLGRTEVVKNDLNPVFSTRIPMNYYFERAQKLKLKIYDSDGDSKEKIGKVETGLNEIMGAKDQRLSIDIKNKSGSKVGTVIISIHDVPNEKFNVTFQCSGQNLDKKDFFGSSDPYLVISKEEGGKMIPVHKTEVIMNNLNPHWKEFSLPLHILCNNKYDLPLMIECYDWDSNSDPDLIGKFQTTLAGIQSKSTFELIHPKKVGKKANSGLLHMKVEILKESTFLDYIMGGAEISLIVAIDFTGSNGDPKTPSSLHYRNPNSGPNEYMQAIYSVGSIIEPYDSDKIFPVFGFGAKLPNGQVSHNFNVTLTDDPKVYGIQGVVEAYAACLDRVQLYGPTNFSSIIKNATSISKQAPPREQKYFVLLILTDGEITDINETIAAIVHASKYPLSIIIIGVGSADFTNMNLLDGDDGKLRTSNQVAARDIVQFVPFRSKAGNLEALAAEVLAEVPNQFLSFMKSNNILPKNVPPRPTK